MRHRTRLHALLCLSLLPLAAAHAAPADLLISEMVEGSSNNKAIEIWNGTGAPVNLATGGYSLQFFFNGAATAGLTINLTGTVADGDVHVVAHGSSVAAILAQADQTNSSGWYNGDDAIVLRRGTTVLDVVGQIGVDPGSRWGTAPASTADNTLRRKATVCAGDTDGGDAFAPAEAWDGYPTDTFDGLGAHAASCGGGPVATDPAASGAASPASLAAGDATLLTVAVVPGTGPDSTGITVAADLSPIGGASTQPLYDDGSHGDAVAGDLTFSFAATVDAGTAGGPVSLPVSVVDDQDRSADTTIGLSIVARRTIAQIQGDGLGSQLPAGTELITEGVVTALRTNGYFIQSAPGEDDGDPATAEGVFVFTNDAPPAGAVVGNRVRVAGRVSLFSRTPHGYPLTQLGNATLTVLSSGATLPEPVVIDAAVLSADVGTGALGRYQGMRVALPSARVVGPTNAFGDFHVTLPETPRPAREPGIAALDATPLPEGHAIPVFDRNPERLRVESTGLIGGTHLFVDAGTQVDGMEGVLYYDRGDFTLLIGSHAGLGLSGGAHVAAVPVAEAGAIRIGSYNIENLSGGESVPLARLEKLTDVFCNYLRTPDVVGLVEIANLETARRLARAINDDEFGTCPESPGYEAHLLSTSGSQRLGFLVKTAATGDGAPRVSVLSVAEQFVGEPLIGPDAVADNLLFDRPPLLLQATVRGENGTDYPVAVLLNHTLSLLDVNDPTPRAVWGTNGDRSRGKRRQQAIRVSQLVESIQSADPAQPLVLIGDYNAFEFSDGYVDVMGIIAGRPAAEGTVLLHGDSAVTRPLTNLIGTKPAAQQYSYVFEGNTQTLDHALVNDAVLDTTVATLHHARVNSDFAVDNAADPTVPVRTSDHDPLVADLVVPAFLDADLAVDVQTAALPQLDGTTVPFSVQVRNDGVARALQTELTLAISATPAQVGAVQAEGWECAPAVAAGTGSQVFCGRVEAMPEGAVDTLAVTVQAWRTAPIQSLQVQARATTRSVDTDAANDADTAWVKVVGRPRWTTGG